MVTDYRSFVSYRPTIDGEHLQIKHDYEVCCLELQKYLRLTQPIPSHVNKLYRDNLKKLCKYLDNKGHKMPFPRGR